MSNTNKPVRKQKTIFKHCFLYYKKGLFNFK